MSYGLPKVRCLFKCSSQLGCERRNVYFVPVSQGQPCSSIVLNGFLLVKQIVKKCLRECASNFSVVPALLKPCPGDPSSPSTSSLTSFCLFLPDWDCSQSCKVSEDLSSVHIHELHLCPIFISAQTGQKHKPLCYVSKSWLQTLKNK